VPVARLFVHHTAGDPGATARARALAERLRDRGAAVVIVRPVPFAVRGLSVRYFHDADRAAATAAVADAAAVAGDPADQGAALRPADFTSFRPAPRPGTIEIWLPGGS
jgi:hypothetical protein